MGGRVWRSVAAGVMVFAVLGVATVELAAACSCMPIDPRARLAEGDQAIVGRALAKQERWSYGGTPGFRYTVRIERGLNTRQTGDATIWAPKSEPTCGIDWSVGERVGAFVRPTSTVRNNNWDTSACGVLDPERLLAAARPVARPRGRGRPVFLAGGGFDGARVMALGPRGHVLAYGYGQGSVFDISVCPGSRFAVELVRRDPGRMFIGVRDLRSFELVRSDWFHGLAEQVHCVDRRSRHIYAGFVNRVLCIQAPCKGEPRVNLYELYRDGSVRSRTLTGGSVAFSGDRAFVGGPRRLMAKRFGERRMSTVSAIDDARQLTASPTGLRLAFASAADSGVIDLDRPGTRRLPSGYRAPLTWIDDDRLLASGSPRAGTFDSRLRRVGQLPYMAASGVPFRGRLFEIEGDRLVATRIEDGKRTRVTRLLGLKWALIRVPDALPLRASRRTPRVVRSTSIPCRKTRRD